MTDVVAILSAALLALAAVSVAALRRLGGSADLDRPVVPAAAEPSYDPTIVAAHITSLDQRAEELARIAVDIDRRGHELDLRDADLAGQATGLRGQAEGLERRDAELGRTRGDLAREAAALAHAQDELAAVRDELASREAALEAERSRIAGLSPAEARAELMAGLLADAQHEAGLAARRIEADAVSTAEERAREIVGQAVQRVATPATAELTVTTLRLPADDYKGRIIGREGRNIRAFETITGVDVLIDETPDVVQLSCFDPVRREIGRLTMAALLADGRIHPQRIEDNHRAAAAEVDAVCRRAAEDALLAVGIGDLDDVLVRHLGALRFRTSYGQNVLAHLVESAAVAATMAAELGADVALVKRCAFLHDIGKALTHEVEGSHALVGADLARRHGESAAVVHAIEAHHNEVTPRTLEAVLTQASDACSGGRPGARRESVAAYTARLQRIEEIAAAQPGVERVFAVQAGHEVRVMVQPDQVDDVAAAQIARAVAKQIEQELTYPGQIRVTVIRESRVSEVAH